MSARIRTAVALLLALVLTGCTRNASPTSGQNATARKETTSVLAGADVFTDMTPESGINFRFRNGEEADEYTILETLGGGVGLIDFDQDGRLDIFLTGGGHFKDKKVLGHPNRLYRNEGDWKFRDVTAEVGLDKVLHYSQGAAVGDYNNDGWPDLLVTGYARLALYRNSQGKFEEVTAAAGLSDQRTPHWSTSAAWGDFNGDGFLDLYICHYLDWSFENHPRCPGYRPGQPVDTCSPRLFKSLVHALYVNAGDGKFRDATFEAGLKAGKGLGVLVADYNDDGKLDIYVANDTTDNFLYLNRTTSTSSSPPYEGGVGGVAAHVQNLGLNLDRSTLLLTGFSNHSATPPNPPFVRGGGRGALAAPVKLDEVALSLSVATGENGKPNGSMGVDAADFDGSGFLSIFVANFQGEMHDLYRNVGRGPFAHATVLTGISVIGQDYVGWGGGFVDYDRDGAEDLLICNGHVARYPPLPATLAQKPVLFRNLRKPGDNPRAVRFAEATKTGGDYFRSDHRARGAALGDLDNDGKIDVVVSHINEPVVVLRNVHTPPPSPSSGGGACEHALARRATCG